MESGVLSSQDLPIKVRGCQWLALTIPGVSFVLYVVCSSVRYRMIIPITWGSPSYFVALALLILLAFSLLGMPSLWLEKLEQECMPFQKTWLKWTPKWSWQCLLASWGKEWRGCKAQWSGAGGGTPDCSALDAPRKHRDDSSHSKLFNLVTSYKIPQKCLFFQPGSLSCI